MVDFKEWVDYNKFMQTYAVACCQNCVGYLDSAMDRGQFVCMRTIAPVNFNLLQVCVEWQGNDGEKLDEVDRDYPFKFSKETFEKLMEIEEELTFDEIKEIIDNEEHKE